MKSKKFSLVISKPIKKFRKKIIVDSDKSLSIRSFLIGSISQGVSIAENVLESEDVYSTIYCLRKLGIKIEKTWKIYKIFGKGLGSFKIKNQNKLNLGNSGTLARLIIGILATTPKIKVLLHGDNSLNKRSMKKLILLMNQFGAEFLPNNKFTFPLRLISSSYPISINYEAGTSAQLKSAVILAGLNSFGKTIITEKKYSRDHTEIMLSKNKQALNINSSKFKTISVNGKSFLNKFKIKIPGDPSSAAFFTALAILRKNSYLKIKNVGLNPTRIGYYNLLKKSGAKINFLNVKKVNNEKVGDILVKSSKLKPIKASKNYYLNTTDEYPILFVISALTNGISKFSGIGDLSNKESDRVKEMQKILKQIGIRSIYKNNSLKIYGNKEIRVDKRKIYVPNLGDHRICMSATILALITGVKTVIKNFETVNTSSPNFLNKINFLGGKFEKK